MNQLSDYLIPIDSDFALSHGKDKLGHNILMYQPESGAIPSTVKIAVLGVPEDRFTGGAGEIKLPEQARRQLYALFGESSDKIIDLGNLRVGATLNDTYFGLKHVMEQLNELGIITLIIGGTLDLFYGLYMTMEQQQPVVTCIAPCLRFPEYGTTHPLNTLIYNVSSPVHFCNIGYQSYYVSLHDLDFLKDEQQYELYRLGEIKANIPAAEPVIRDSDMVALSMNAVRWSECPASSIASPNGFTGEDVCQMAYYAGLSHRCRAFYLSDTLLQNDMHGITAKLAAQTAWYFLEGAKRRNIDHPSTVEENFKKYLIYYDQLHYNLCFYKNISTERWWMEVPSAKGEQYNRIIACTAEDYTQAVEQKIPDRWWKIYQKIN